MTRTSATAMLVGTRDMFATRPRVLTTTVARSEIEEALSFDPPAELVLDVVRTPEGSDGAEPWAVNVAWTRADLETVLEGPGSDAITFSFDPAELEQAIEGSEVEGHGLRETAVVLTIAAAAAASGASGALGAVHDEASSSQRGIAAPITAAAHTEMGSTERGITAEAAVHDEASLTARGIETATPAVHDEATYAARGIEPGTLPATHDEATYAARGIEPGTLPATPAVHDEATLSARGIDAGAPEPVVDTGSGFEIPSVDDTTVAAIAGGLAGAGLLIAAAAFATRRREPGTV